MQQWRYVTSAGHWIEKRCLVFCYLFCVLCSLHCTTYTSLHNRATWTLHMLHCTLCDVASREARRTCLTTACRGLKHLTDQRSITWLEGRKVYIFGLLKWGSLYLEYREPIQEFINYFESLWKYFWNYYLVTIVSPWAPYPWGPVILLTPEAPPQPPPKSR